MYPRTITLPRNKSFFLLGPRGTGKSTLVKKIFQDSYRIDLLNQSVFQELVRNPGLLEAKILGYSQSSGNPVVIDEIQKIPELLDDVHRLIEERKIRFVLTGSSARKLRRAGVNLLGGRARRLEMFPLTAEELGSDFEIGKSLKVGHLPEAYTTDDPEDYLKSYVGAYLREEVQQEALVRSLVHFSSFLEAAAFSQGSVLNVQNVANDCGVDRKTSESYFCLLEDLLIGVRIPCFQKRAKRKMANHPKFFYFDVGVFRTLRRQGPLDPEPEIEGVALETLALQELRAFNGNHALNYELSYWRTARGEAEVDFVLYGQKGFHAIEIKRSSKVRQDDLRSLKVFGTDYPQAKLWLLYMGKEKLKIDNISVIPVADALLDPSGWLAP